MTTRKAVLVTCLLLASSAQAQEQPDGINGVWAPRAWLCSIRKNPERRFVVSFREAKLKVEQRICRINAWQKYSPDTFAYFAECRGSEGEPVFGKVQMSRSGMEFNKHGRFGLLRLRRCFDT